MKMIFGKQMIIGLIVSLVGIGSWHITERSDAYDGWIKVISRECMLIGLLISINSLCSTGSL